MHIEVNVRHRPDPSESISQRHRALVAEISALKGLGRGATAARTPPSLELGEGGEQGSGASDFTDVVQTNFRAAVHYGPRISGLDDAAMYDDFLTLQFRAEDIDYADFVARIIPALVRILRAYLITVDMDEQLAAEDYERAVKLHIDTGADVDARRSVWRINPVNYFGRQLCCSAFGLPPEDMVRKLRGKVERIELVEDGVLLIVTSRVIGRKEIEEIDSKMRSALTY